MKIKNSQFKVKSLFKRLFTIHYSLFTVLLLFTFHFSLFTLIGCGYKLQGRESLPFQSVKIGKIENRTYEPKLEDKLKKALSDEFIRNGIMISGNADHVISGVIEGFELKPLSEKEGLAAEYEVIMKGKFFLTSPEGKVTQLRNSPVFIVSFYSTGSIQDIMASKESAITAALTSIASEIRAGIIYGQSGKVSTITKEKPNTR